MAVLHGDLCVFYGVWHDCRHYCCHMSIRMSCAVVQGGKPVWSAEAVKHVLSGADLSAGCSRVGCWHWVPTYSCSHILAAAANMCHSLHAANFTLVEEREMPFVIREHRRKFQWGVSHATVWRRK